MKNSESIKTITKGGFWGFYDKLNRKSVIKNVYARFLETGRFGALKCDWRDNQENEPHYFWDSDVAKWIEAVGYILETEENPELEAIVDGLVDDIVSNQRADGYFNSYFIAIKPTEKFLYRPKHELYCLGHLIEAAIAYDNATGKDKLLRAMLKFVDLVYKVFLVEDSAGFITPGHEEIELALLRLYEYTGDEKHLELARFFIDKRGNNDKDEKVEYNQSLMPVRETTYAYGHAVRGGYLYTAMAGLAKIDNDAKLKEACDKIYEDITTRKMSITGGIGAERVEEKFSYPYDLPNSEVYNETCAAISLVMFAEAMQKIEPKACYGDIIERVLYNGYLSGLSLDGSKFFYTNPLEVDRKKTTRSAYRPIFERVKVFNCSCCPPNVARTLSTVGKYAYTVKDNTVYCHQFMDSTANFTVADKEATLVQKTNYPADGRIVFTYSGAPATLLVRIPEWCVEYAGKSENGYAKFELTDGCEITVDLPMNIHFIESNPNVQDNSGRYAVQRGPIVYCLEEIDNGENLRDVTIIENGNFRVESEDSIPAPVIYADAERRAKSDALYSIKNDKREAFTAKLIPYFAFANREATDMIVWTMVK